MCEANAYLFKDGKEELILEDVDELITQNDGIFLKNIFGEQKTISARLKELHLVEHRIILEEK